MQPPSPLFAPAPVKQRNVLTMTLLEAKKHLNTLREAWAQMLGQGAPEPSGSMAAAA